LGQYNEEIPYVAKSLNKLAMCLAKLIRLKEAEKNSNEAFKIAQKILGDEEHHNHANETEI